MRSGIRWVRFLGLLSLAWFTLWAQAGPITAGGVLSAQRGGTVSPTVRDASLSAFEAADLTVGYDPAVLAYTGLSASGLLGVSSLVAVDNPDGARRLVTLSLALATPFTGTDIELLVAQFMVQAGAAIGDTVVSFRTLDATLYDLDLDVRVSVLAAPPGVPEPASLALATLALAGAAAAGRRRR